jgi:hypothetical protein
MAPIGQRRRCCRETIKNISNQILAADGSHPGERFSNCGTSIMFHAAANFNVDARSAASAYLSIVNSI